MRQGQVSGLCLWLTFFSKRALPFLRFKFLQEFLSLNWNGAENKHEKEMHRHKSQV